MANTPGGLPYPVGTDFVVDGDNAIRALAEEVDGEIYSLFRVTSPGTIAYVGGAIPWGGAKSGPDASTLDATKTIITLARTGVYRVEPHLGLAANAGGGCSSALHLNGVVFNDSLSYGNAGAAGVFIANQNCYVTAVGGVTTIKQAAVSQLGCYDWTWLRLTYIRRAR